MASGRYFFVHKQHNLFVKCSFTVDTPNELPKKTKELIIPTILLEYDEYEVSSSQWLIQPIADTKYQIKTFRELKENKDYRFFCDGCKYNVGRLNGKAVVIDW